MVVLSMSDLMLHIYTPEESCTDFLLKSALLCNQCKSMINNVTHSSANLSSFIVFLRLLGSTENLKCTQPVLELAPSLLPITKNVLFGITTARKVNLVSGDAGKHASSGGAEILY